MPTKSVPTLVLVVALLLPVAILAACGGASSGSGSPAASSPAASAEAPSEAGPSEAASEAAAGGSTVSIKNFAFGPATVSVAVGTTVTWTNEDSAPHTATADDGAFDSKNIAPGATFSQAFDTAGTFAYHCSIHPNMTGTIEVK